MDKNVTLEQLAAYDQAFDADLAKRVAMRAVKSLVIGRQLFQSDVLIHIPTFLSLY